MAGFGTGFKPVNPFASQVARNTTGFREQGSFIPKVATSNPVFNPQVAAIQGDPGYASAANDATRSANDAQSARQAQIRQLLIQYGGQLPAGFKDTYGDVDQATRDIANANPYSQYAQSLRQFGQTQTANRQAEAANGSIFSGQLPTDIGNENYARGLDLYNLANQFSGHANDAIGQYAGVLNTNAGKMTDAVFKAEQVQSQNPAYLPPQTQTPVTKNTTITPRGAAPSFSPSVNPFARKPLP